MSVFVGVFRCCKYMAKNRQFQILEGKISTKGRFFFDGRTRIGRVGVVVWCVCRPSSRLCVSMLRSSFASNATLIFDIRPIIRHLHTTSFFSSSLTYGLLFHGLLFHSFLSITSFRARGGFKGGYYIKGY